MRRVWRGAGSSAPAHEYRPSVTLLTELARVSGQSPVAAMSPVNASCCGDRCLQPLQDWRWSMKCQRKLSGAQYDPGARLCGHEHRHRVPRRWAVGLLRVLGQGTARKPSATTIVSWPFCCGAVDEEGEPACWPGARSRCLFEREGPRGRALASRPNPGLHGERTYVSRMNAVADVHDAVRRASSKDLVR